MNAQIQEEESRIVRYHRAEYIRKARESCINNFYGDRMQSDEEIRKEVALKKQREEEAVIRKHEKQKTERLEKQDRENSSVIPFRDRRTSAAEGRINQATEVRMDADAINRRLATEKTARRVNDRIEESGFDTKKIPELTQLNQEYPKGDLESDEKIYEENVPQVEDILKMSGIVENRNDEIQNNYVSEYTQTYREEQPSNFLTSIRNAPPEEDREEPKKVEEGEKFHLFAVRWIFAFLVLAAVILMDKFKFDFKGFNMKTVYEKMVSTEIAEQVEEYIVRLSGK